MAEEELRTLPPGIDGNHTGTLTICFRQCSVPGVVAHIKFWGDVGCDVYPNKSINFALVGERSAIATYLRDASPLHIKILSKDKDSLALIGNVFIPDLSLPAPAQQSQSLDHKRSSKGVISLGQTIIGDATFELYFRLMHTQPQLEADIMAIRHPSQQHVGITDFEMNQLLEQADNECQDQDSELCGSTTEEKYSLISELLDICSDDMTIPTVDTSLVAATGVDPYDLWISNIVSSASSPPRTSIKGNETITACEQPNETAVASETFPHPISLFLSNVATAANANATATQVRSSSMTQPEATVERLPSAPVPPKLEPMQPPPIWIDVGVYCISNLRLAVVGSSPCCLELNLMCNEPLLSLCDLVQSSAFRGDEPSNYSSENVKTVVMRDECRELASFATHLSWQAGLKTLNCDIEIKLQIRYFCEDEQVIIGNVSIPLECKQLLESSDTLGLLPRFEANGWFDILDPSSRSRASIGRIQLSLASGTLKQIRSLPKAHNAAASIQRVWRKKRSNKRCTTSVGKEDEAPQPDEEELSERIRKSLGQNDDEDVDGDTVNSHPPPPPDDSDDISAKQTHAESSPDSLFEEWSQQSFLHVDANEKEELTVNAARAAENDVGLTVDTSLVESVNADKDVRVYTIMDEVGGKRNDTFNPTMSNSASNAAELQDLLCSSHVQLDPQHHSSRPNKDAPNSQRRKPIDPPEGYDLPKMKRKMDQSLSSSSSFPDAKRHRTNAEDSPSESQVASPPNLYAGAKYMSYVDEEDSFDEDCRSLQSVMKSLADVEARLKCDNSSNTPPTSVLECHYDASISADVAVDDRSETGSVKTSQIQTPPETGSTKTAIVETCEKGTSPLCVTSRYKDASTSPCEEEGRTEVQDEEEKEDGGNKDDLDNGSEERVGTLKNDDRSTLQLDWSLNKTRDHSAQGLFPTLSTSSDRRERYGSLFSSQSSYPHGALRLGSLLSPTGGAPRIEGTRVDSSSYKRYLSGRRKPPDAGVPSCEPYLHSSYANSDSRIEQIFSGNKKKKED